MPVRHTIPLGIVIFLVLIVSEYEKVTLLGNFFVLVITNQILSNVQGTISELGDQY